MLLLIICLIGAWLRFKHLNKNLHFFYSDGARDSLIVKHMVEYNEEAPRPYLGFGQELLNNSPFYYQVLSLVWVLWPSPLGLIYFFAILGTLQIIVNYLVGLKIKNKQLGLLLALFTALSSILINSSRSILQANMMPLLTSLIIAAGLMSMEKAKGYFVSLYIFFCLTALHFHLSILLLFPTLIFFGLLFLKKIKEESGFTEVLIQISILIFLSWLWIMSTENYKIATKFADPTINNSVFNLKNFIYNLSNNLKFLIESILINLTSAHIFIFFLFGTLSLISIFFTKKKEQAIFLSLAYFSYILSALFGPKITLYHHRMMPFYTIFSLVSIKSLFELIPNKLFVTIFVLFLTLLAINPDEFKLRPQNNNSYQAAKQVADQILQDCKLQKANQNFVVYALDKNLKSNWFSGSIYYQLEKISGKKLVEIVPLNQSKNNLRWLKPDGKFIYAICEYDQKNTQYCHNYIKQKHSQSEFISGQSLDLPTWHNIALLKYRQ